jgi:hydroxypyruvate isomerase
MARFAANLTMLFGEVPFLERFALAAQHGFKAVEFLFPYPYPVEQLGQTLETHRLELVLHNLPAGDWDAGERGIACLPDRVEEFRAGVHQAISYASRLGVHQLNCLAGKTPADVDPGLVHATLVSNLRYAASRLAEERIRLLIEPINTFDIPGFHLSRSRQALALIDEVATDNLWLQYDVYHMQRMEGEIAATIKAHLNRIAHVQIADNPGRNEPGTGEIHFPFLLSWLDRIGYTGWIGCEYKPASTTAAGLGWLAGSC